MNDKSRVFINLNQIMTKKKELKKISTPNLKHQAFALEFLKDFNATRSYKEVYKVSQENAERSWPRLLGNVGVQKLLSNKIEKTFEKQEVTAEWVVSNIVEIINKCQQKAPVKKTIKSVTLDEEWNEKIITETVEVIWDFLPKEANNWLEKLGKMLKLWTDVAPIINVDIVKIGKKK